MTEGRLLIGPRNIYLAMYPEAHHLNIGVPPALENNFERCAKIFYRSRVNNASQKDVDRSVDLFLFKGDMPYQQLKFILESHFKERNGRQRIHIESGPDLERRCGLINAESREEADKRFGIRYFIQSEFTELAEEITRYERADIALYFRTRKHPVNQANETLFEITPQVLLPPNIGFAKRKAEVKYGTKGQTHDFCIQDLTLDFTRGCKAYMEIIDDPKQGNFFFFNPGFGCLYCFDCWFNKNDLVFGIRRADENDLKKQIRKLDKQVKKDKQRPSRMLRLGAATEVLNEELWPQTETAIRAATEMGKQVGLPTKTPLEDPYVMDFLKEHQNVMVQVSIGIDSLEIGVLKQGYPNERRMEIARKYHEAGINTMLYPLTDLSTHPEEQKLRSASEAYYIHKELGIPLQFLLFRTSNKHFMELVTDKPVLTRTELKPLSPEEFNDDIYLYYQSLNTYIPQKTHPFYIDVIEKKLPNLGVCSVSPLESLCSDCFTSPARKRLGPHKKKPLPDADKRKLEKQQRAKKVRRKQFMQEHTFQEKLFPEMFEE